MGTGYPPEEPPGLTPHPTAEPQHRPPSPGGSVLGHPLLSPSGGWPHGSRGWTRTQHNRLRPCRRWGEQQTGGPGEAPDPAPSHRPSRAAGSGGSRTRRWAQREGRGERTNPALGHEGCGSSAEGLGGEWAPSPALTVPWHCRSGCPGVPAPPVSLPTVRRVTPPTPALRGAGNTHGPGTVSATRDTGHSSWESSARSAAASVPGGLGPRRPWSPAASVPGGLSPRLPRSAAASVGFPEIAA